MDKEVVVRALDAVFAAQGGSAAHKAIFREVYGDDYPEEAEPFGYTALRDLARVASELEVRAGQTFIDCGCGRGGLGLWVARETGASLVGVDFSREGIREAQRRTSAFVPEARASFEVGDLTDLRFEDARFAAAMSLAVIWMVPDPGRAVSEIARVLEPGARFVFTDWDRELSPPGAPPAIPDHRPLLEDAGFEVLRYEVVADAEAKRRRVYELYLERQEILTSEMGQDAMQVLLFEAKRALGLLDGRDYLAHSRQIFVIAKRS